MTTQQDPEKRQKRHALNELSICVAADVKFIAEKHRVHRTQLGDALILALLAASLHDQWRDFFGLSL